jgi:hypothetical protein
LQKFVAVHGSVHNHFNAERPSTTDQASSSTVPLLWPSGAVSEGHKE